MKYFRNVLICTLSLAILLVFTGCSKKKDQQTMSSNIPTSSNGDTDSMIKEILAENNKNNIGTKDKYKTKLSLPITKNPKLSDYNFNKQAEASQSNSSSESSSNSNYNSTSGYNNQFEFQEPINNVTRTPNNTLPIDPPFNNDDFDDDNDDVDEVEIVKSPAYNKLSQILINNGELNSDDGSTEYSIGYECSNERNKIEYFINHNVKNDENYIDSYLYSGEEMQMAFYLDLPVNNESTDTLLAFTIPNEKGDDIALMGYCALDAKSLTRNTSITFQYMNEIDTLTQEEKEDMNSLGQIMCCNMLDILQQCLTEYETNLTLKDFGFNSYK